MKIFQGVFCEITGLMKDGSGFCFSRHHFITFAETLDQAIDKTYANFQTAPYETNHLFISQTDKEVIDCSCFENSSTISVYKTNKNNPHGDDKVLALYKKEHPEQYYQIYDEPPECLINYYEKWRREQARSGF
jgi:hypothetical protein